MHVEDKKISISLRSFIGSTLRYKINAHEGEENIQYNYTQKGITENLTLSFGLHL